MCMYCEKGKSMCNSNIKDLGIELHSGTSKLVAYGLDEIGWDISVSCDINYCPICRKEVGRVNEDEIRKRIEILEIRKNGYLEVGNTNQVRKIENEIHKWEDLLERINGSLEKKVEKLENFIKSKDLWESYLHF